MTTTLLGVDDSKTLRKVLEITFAGEDVRTVLAENPDDAMSKLHAERPSIVLLDAGLEGTNGYDLCQRLKAATPGVGVILLSSKQQPYDRNRGQQVGADDFIDKPFDTQQLIDKVGTVLRRLSSGAGSGPAMTTTAHGLGTAQVAPALVARPPAPELGSRLRTQTLAYGSHQNPMASSGPGPVAPLVPPPAFAGAAPPARPNAPAAPAPAPAARSAATETPTTGGGIGLGPANGAALAQKLSAIGLTQEQVSAVLALSREVVEQVVWEVVPVLAEKMIEEEIRRLTAE